MLTNREGRAVPLSYFLAGLKRVISTAMNKFGENYNLWNTNIWGRRM